MYTCVYVWERFLVKSFLQGFKLNLISFVPVVPILNPSDLTSAVAFLFSTDDLTGKLFIYLFIFKTNKQTKGPLPPPKKPKTKKITTTKSEGLL